MHQAVVYKSSTTLAFVRDTLLQLLKSSGMSRRQNFEWVFGETFSFRFLSSSLVACFTFIPPTGEVSSFAGHLPRFIGIRKVFANTPRNVNFFTRKYRWVLKKIFIEMFWSKLHDFSVVFPWPVSLNRVQLGMVWKISAPFHKLHLKVVCDR